MTEYELTKESKKILTPPFTIHVETEDIKFLNYLDEKLDELIKEYYKE